MKSDLYIMLRVFAIRWYELDTRVFDLGDILQCKDTYMKTELCDILLRLYDAPMKIALYFVATIGIVEYIGHFLYSRERTTSASCKVWHFERHLRERFSETLWRENCLSEFITDRGGHSGRELVPWIVDAFILKMLDNFGTPDPGHRAHESRKHQHTTFL